MPASPMEVFKLVLATNIVEEMDHTNRYAEEVMGPGAFESWTNIMEEDIRAFIGFLILMGINQQSSIDYFWKHDPIDS